MEHFAKRHDHGGGTGGTNMANIVLNDPNLIWASYLCCALTAVVVFLTVRRITLKYTTETYSRPVSPAIRAYLRIDRLIVNKLAYHLRIGPLVLPSPGMVLAIVSFFAVVLCLLLYNSDIYINTNRAGFLALATIPFAFAFAGKNSGLTLLTGLSHEKLNFFHRWIGRATFMLATFHMVCQILHWSEFTWFLNLQLQDPKVRYGLVAYSVLGTILLTSFWPVRRYLYRVFATFHLLFVVLLVIIAIHTPYAMRFTCTGIMLYILDQLAGWTIKTHLARARVHILEDGCTKITVATELRRRPGQHVYLWVPSVSVVGWHPFTISNVSGSTITLHVQAMGPFTSALRQLPQGAEMTVGIAGPYGEPPKLHCVKSALLMAGGSGASFTIPILLDLVYGEDTSFERKVTFVWCISRLSQLTWFQRDLETALSLTKGTTLRLSIRIHVSANSLDGSSEGADWKLATELPNFVDSDPRVLVVMERMRCPCMIDGVLQAVEVPHEVVHVVACGPDRLLHDVRNTVARKTKLRGNPIELYCESFAG